MTTKPFEGQDGVYGVMRVPSGKYFYVQRHPGRAWDVEVPTKIDYGTHTPPRKDIREKSMTKEFLDHVAESSCEQFAHIQGLREWKPLLKQKLIDILQDYVIQWWFVDVVWDGDTLKQSSMYIGPLLQYTEIMVHPYVLPLKEKSYTLEELEDGFWLVQFTVQAIMDFLYALDKTHIGGRQIFKAVRDKMEYTKIWVETFFPKCRCWWDRVTPAVCESDKQGTEGDTPNE